MKNKIISISFCSFLIMFLLLNVFVKDKDVSESERRKLQQSPSLSIGSIVDASFMEKIDKYTLDQFVFRDNFRSLKANINYNFLLKLDNNKIYLKDGHIFKTEYPTNLKSITNFTDKINNIVSTLNIKNNVYYSIIPDKNYYVKSEAFLNIDYELLYNQVIQNLSINYIDLRDVLELNDYYKQDTHWKQESIEKVVKKLSTAMNFNDSDNNYQKTKIENFFGVYYGQAALKRKPEIITLLTNDVINNAVVDYYENKDINNVYTYDKLNSLDKYDVFLNGASSFIEIYNENNKTNKELVIFRDSFGSSIAPLLINSYSKITLIDTRYITSDNYSKLIDFNDQDVLFLYSTLIVNNSSILKN